jgi:hypothetical protein
MFFLYFEKFIVSIYMDSNLAKVIQEYFKISGDTPAVTEQSIAKVLRQVLSAAPIILMIRYTVEVLENFSHVADTVFIYSYNASPSIISLNEIYSTFFDTHKYCRVFLA